jgi:ABC-2 type transport system permease protein
MKTWTTLIRREYWENRSLWVAPLCAAAFMIVGSIALVARWGQMRIGPRGGSGAMPDLAATGKGFVMAVYAFASFIVIVGTLALAAYVFDCLYSERKDRSILFWKSLPVSDSETVLSKLFVALVATPVGIFLLAVITHLICGAILTIRPPVGMPTEKMWQAGPLLHAYGRLGGVFAVNALWFAPQVAYGMLASVLARRAPMVIALLPPLLVMVGERMILGTTEAARWFFARSEPQFDLEQALMLPGMWIGVGVAVILVLVVIRLRRWRDDS